MIVVFATATTAHRALGKHWSGRKPRPPPGAPSPPAPPSVPPYVAEDDIFCHNGHQLPMLFLLGAQKCGSTSLVYELWDQYGFAHGLPYRGRFNDGCDSYNDNKEKHFFEDDCRRAKTSGASGRAAKASPRRAAPSRTAPSRQPSRGPKFERVRAQEFEL